MEIGQKYTILQKTNNINTNQANRLSVQVTLYGLSFLILSSESDAPKLIERNFDSARTPEELLEELKKVFNTELELSQSFSEVRVIYSSQYFTLVPTSLFDESKASEYLKFNTKILSNDFVSHDTINNYDISIVYVPFVNINNFLFEKFGDFNYYHSSSILLKYLLDSEKLSQETKVFLNIKKEWFDCIVIKNGTVELCNSYPFKTEEDLLYFTLFTFEQLKLNPDTIKVKLSGNIKNEDSLFKLLYKYIRHISFIENTPLTLDEESNHTNLVLKI